MKGAQLRAAFDELAAFPKLTGCALVAVDTGMVWHASGDDEKVQHLAEAASDYWRLYVRLGHNFAELGELQASVMLHQLGCIALLPCGKGMVLVALTPKMKDLDWLGFQAQVRKLSQVVDAM